MLYLYSYSYSDNITVATQHLESLFAYTSTSWMPVEKLFYLRREGRHKRSALNWNITKVSHLSLFYTTRGASKLNPCVLVKDHKRTHLQFQTKLLRKHSKLNLALLLWQILYESFFPKTFRTVSSNCPPNVYRM